MKAWHLLLSMRPHHWVKNLLVFLPLFAAHETTDGVLFGRATILFFAFSFLASGVYLFNDLIDRKADQLHPTKKKRPIAAGNLTNIPVLVAGILSLSVGLFGGALLSWQVIATLGIYLVCNLLYSTFLKRVILLDVFLLASLYALRVFAGGVATHIEISPWLLALSIFLFLSLAFLKRTTELVTLEKSGASEVSGRGYSYSDITLLTIFGSISAYMAVLVLALYVTGEKASLLYRNPDLLWINCLILLYWLNRAWLLGRRGKIDSDPVIFVLKDRVTLIVTGLVLIVFWLARAG